jgi:hypothetical protein
MSDTPIRREDYVCRLLEAYRKTPTTVGQIRRADRLLAAKLYDEGIPLAAAANALLLGAARRLLRPEGAPTLEPVRSLYYFRGIIDEVMKTTTSEDYFEYLRTKIAKYISATGRS